MKAELAAKIAEGARGLDLEVEVRDDYRPTALSKDTTHAVVIGRRVDFAAACSRASLTPDEARLLMAVRSDSMGLDTIYY